MKCAEDFRKIASNALAGKWTTAVIVGLVAVLLGGAVIEGPEFKLNIDYVRRDVGLEIEGLTIYPGDFSPEMEDFLLENWRSFTALFGMVIPLIRMVIGSVIGVGYARFNLELVDRKEPGFKHLFKYCAYWENAICTSLLKGLYVSLGLLLLIIPGIIAAYNYRMTEYILAEHPEMTAREVLAASKDMMYCSKWRLFCLDISFIGWYILCLFTFGVGNLWLNPYKHAASAAFYREISGTEQVLFLSPLDSDSALTEI